MPNAQFRPFIVAATFVAAMTAQTRGVASQDWSSFFNGTVDGPARGAPTSPSSWRVLVVREAATAADPRWTATVAFAKVPLVVANPIPRAPPRSVNPLTGKNHLLEGIASFYWQDQMTATGERFDRTAMTAAHRTLPMNSRVRVTNVVNGRSVVVRINDRGPFKPGRIIDLSEAAATVLDMQKHGLVPVKIQLISNQ